MQSEIIDRAKTENTWQRAWRDTEKFRTSIWFWIFESFVTGGGAWVYGGINGWNNAEIIALWVVLIAASIIALYLFFAISAPRNQREELRLAIEAETKRSMEAIKSLQGQINNQSPELYIQVFSRKVIPYTPDVFTSNKNSENENNIQFGLKIKVLNNGGAASVASKWAFYLNPPSGEQIVLRSFRTNSKGARLENLMIGPEDLIWSKTSEIGIQPGDAAIGWATLQIPKHFRSKILFEQIKSADNAFSIDIKFEQIDGQQVSHRVNFGLTPA